MKPQRRSLSKAVVLTWFDPIRMPSPVILSNQSKGTLENRRRRGSREKAGVFLFLQSILSMEDVVAKYVSQKVSKTRWRPVSATALQPPEVFATGSWDNEENNISIWSVGDFEGLGLTGEYHGEPHLLCDIQHSGDVMDLQFLDQERIVAASSNGTVTIFKHHQNNETLSVSRKWEKAHHYNPSYSSASCTGITCNCPEIFTVGEDGKINLFTAERIDAVRTLDNADSSTLHAVTYLRTTEILTVNSIGQLKIWDFRQQGNEPSQIFSLTGERVPLHCVDRHPNQQHIVATGGQDGVLSIWDVRQGSMPASLLKAHEAELWEVHFHPSSPDHLFTCSEDGSLWHWDASMDVSGKKSLLHTGGRSSTFLSHSTVNQSIITPWLSNDPAKDRIETTNLISSPTLSINSLDVLRSCLVYGTDAESIYVKKNLFT